MHPTGDIDLVITTDDLLSGLGWLPSGDMLIVLMNEQQIIRLKANDVLTGNLTSTDACCLGGVDERDLYLCESTRFGQTRHLGDGRIRSMRVDVPAA